jgi:hypothetical protein
MIYNAICLTKRLASVGRYNSILKQRYEKEIRDERQKDNQNVGRVK